LHYPTHSERTQFAGCVVVISHDRWFLERIVSQILPEMVVTGTCDRGR
jgi:hypothetical protein